jgi:putative membrane protein
MAKKREKLMSNYFNDEIRGKIAQAIAQIESQSHVEVVVIIKSRVHGYAEYPLATGSALAFIALTYFRFSNDFYADWVVYTGTVFCFILGALLVGGIPALLRFEVGQNRLRKSAEIMARASFQKGGIHHTMDKTGVLIFLAVWEKQIIILPDRGVESAIPPGEWERIRQDFQGVFEANNPAHHFVTKLESLSVAFSRYIPQVENDMNELPDHLEIDL